MKIKYPLWPCLAVALCAGCHAKKADESAADATAPKASGEKIVFPANSPQRAALVVEPVSAEQAAVLRLNGRVTWDDDVTVRVFSPFAGRVNKIMVEPGQAVAAEESLAWIASADYGQAQADTRKAASDFILADRSLNRVRDLFEHGAAPQKDLLSAEADYARAASERQRTAARLALYGGNTETIDQVFQLKTPIQGVVVEKNLTPGQEVRPDQMLANAPQFFAPLFVVTDPARLWVQLDAAEHDLPNLSPGQPITVRSRAYPEETFPGTIEVVSEFLDPATRTVKVRGAIANARRLLKAEMFVTVELSGGPHAGLDVSAKAVFLKGDRHYLFVEERAGEYLRREVKVGPEHAGKVPVLEGLVTGQRIVTDGCLLLEQVLQSDAGS